MKKILIGVGIVFLVIILIIVGLMGQSILKARKALPFSEDFVEVFYQHYNNKDASYIYDELCSDVLRQMVLFEDFKKIVIEATINKLGKVVKKERESWNIGNTPKGTLLTLKYKTSREKSESTDTIVLIQEGNSWLLAGYNVNSKDLIQ